MYVLPLSKRSERGGDLHLETIATRVPRTFFLNTISQRLLNNHPLDPASNAKHSSEHDVRKTLKVIKKEETKEKRRKGEGKKNEKNRGNRYPRATFSSKP